MKKQSSPFDLVYPDTAGIDLGSDRHYVAVPETGEGPFIRSFGCFTQDLREMGEWLKSHGIKHVAMESTGVYWIPVYEALSAMGFDVRLVDARSAKPLPGRKTDVKDCQWIRDLYAHGLVRSCLVPEADVLALRSYWRQRGRLIEQRSEQIQLMQKALEQMNLQLHKVLSDITGVSGMAIIRAILAGERSPHVLAELTRAGVKRSKEDIAKALEGSWAAHHLFALGQAVETFDFYGERLKECDARIDAQLGSMTGGGPGSAPSGKPRKNQPSFDLESRVLDLLKVNPSVIDGLNVMTVLTLVSELGTDLSRFPTEQHLCSYLGLSPNNQITGGRIKKGRTRKVTSRAATALKLSAQSLHHSNSALGGFFRRLRARLGPKKAITATARKIAIHYYRLVRYGVIYNDLGAEQYQDQLRAQTARRLRRQAKKLGLTLSSIQDQNREAVATFS